MPLEEFLKLQRGSLYQSWMATFEFWFSILAGIVLIFCVLSLVWILYPRHKLNKQKKEVGGTWIGIPHLPRSQRGPK